MNSENELIKKCLSGDKEAWDDFVEQYSRLVYDSIRRPFYNFGIDINDDILDDLHNDVFVALLKDKSKALRRFEGRNGCKLASYIRTIAVNTTINYLRRQRNIISIYEEQDIDNGKKVRFIKELTVFNTYDLLDRKEAVEIVNQLFSELEVEERKFCQMCFIDNVAANIVAEQLGISTDNFYVRKQRMLEKLRSIAKDKKIC